MRSNRLFPINDEQNVRLCQFLNDAWKNGWLDEYSDEHFLIKVIENRLTSFLGKQQLIENNINLHGIINCNGNVNMATFNLNFCINFSNHMQFLSERFGEENIKKFIMHQMSAGKSNYKEETFFQALSEVSILSFYAQKHKWKDVFYEPALIEGINNKNPEARFIGSIFCKIDGKDKLQKRIVKINIEVKTPEFSRDEYEIKQIAIPTVLLTERGRKEIKKFCKKNDIVYLDPRVLKLITFINSAAEKFSIPKENEFNLLYINWSYREFLTNSFLEAWSLLTNEVNGILLHSKIGIEMGISPDAYEKISAIIVYTESLEGLMFSDFRYTWQRGGVGERFRMWVLNEKLRKAELIDDSNILSCITGANPSESLTQMVMFDGKSKSDDEEIQNAIVGMELVQLIKENTKK